jgi:enoyl-CoA hydratase
MIHREERGPVSVLRIEHGKVQALDLELLQELTGALASFEGSASRACVITGTGASFSAGVDLFRILDGGRAYVERFLPALDEMLHAMFAAEKPIVAAVNGHAIAGGCIMACACDQRVMARGKGRVGVPELLVGVPFPSLALEIVRFATPAQHLQELVYGGATYAVDDALGRGLVDEVVEAEALLERAIDVATRFAGVPSGSFALVKRQLRSCVLERWRASREHDDQVREAWCAVETHAAIRRYLEQTIGKSR